MTEWFYNKTFSYAAFWSESVLDDLFIKFTLMMRMISFLTLLLVSITSAWGPVLMMQGLDDPQHWYINLLHPSLHCFSYKVLNIKAGMTGTVMSAQENVKHRHRYVSWIHNNSSSNTHISSTLLSSSSTVTLFFFFINPQTLAAPSISMSSCSTLQTQMTMSWHPNEATGEEAAYTPHAGD